MKKKFLFSFKIFSGISPPAALFENKSFTMSFTNASETSVKKFTGDFIVTFGIFNTEVETKALYNSFIVMIR